jgi:hypothetical protein
MKTSCLRMVSLGIIALSSMVAVNSLIAADIPHRIYVGSFYEQEVFDQTAPGTECYPGAPCYYSGSSLLRIWDPSSAGFEQYVTSPSCVDENGDQWCGGQNVTTRWPETTWPPQGFNGTQVTRTYYSDCTSMVETNTVGPMFGIPWVHRDITTTEWWEGHRCFWDDGTLFGPTYVQWHPTRLRRANTTIMLYTGIEDILPIPGPPPPGSAMGPAIFRIRAPVTDVDTGLPINPTNVTVQGVRANASGDIFLLANENIHVNVTPQTPAAFRNTQYDVTAEKSKPQIWRILPDGSRTNITDRTQTVWVGEQIDLTCSSTGSWTNFTNCTWTVPGITVAGWNSTITQAVVIPFTNRNSGAIRYYWVDGHAPATVECRIAIGGMTFNLRTHFTVIRPFNYLTSTSASAGVTVDSLYLVVPALHFGDSRSRAAGVAGMVFSYDAQVAGGQWTLCQVVASTMNRVRQTSGQWWRLAATNVLDEVFPFTDTNDSPGVWLESQPFNTPPNAPLDYAIAHDVYSTTLMFMPAVGNAIWVPIRQVTWSWRGSASWAGGTWSLVPGSASHTPNPGSSETTLHPTWTNNVQSYGLSRE